MKILVGIEGGRRPVLARAKKLGVSILVSANSMWRDNTKRFTGFESYRGHTVALDSGGFIAMKKYGRYRWSVSQYADLAKQMNPIWWAQMDFCCEPEIAADRRVVFKRIDRTVEYLNRCNAAAQHVGVDNPMPVLQGWKPDDYCSGPIYDSNFDWPDLVGVGSVCRRHIHGPDGIMAVADAIDRKVPEHVRFHFFGVKSNAMQSLMANFPDRIASVDSMAWNFSCRRDAFDAGVVCNGEMRADYMEQWYLKQHRQVTTTTLQPLLF